MQRAVADMKAHPERYSTDTMLWLEDFVKAQKLNTEVEIPKDVVPAGKKEDMPNTGKTWAGQQVGPLKGRGTLNARNNNPGNMEYGPFARKHGAIGTDGRFAIFPDKETGSAAMDAKLQEYGGLGVNTVSSIIGKWAPPEENDTTAYVKAVAKRLGVKPDQKLDFNDSKIRAALGREIARYEGDASAYVNTFDRPMDKKIPDNAPSPNQMQAQAQNVQIRGEFLLKDHAGKQLADTSIETRVGRPKAYGVPGGVRG